MTARRKLLSKATGLLLRVVDGASALVDEA
jgi:hypothetical protein